MPRQTRTLAVWGLVAACLACRAPAPAPATTPESFERPRMAPVARTEAELRGHARARERVRELDGEAALEAYARLLNRDPGDALAGLGLAQTALEFGLEDRAAVLLARVVDDNRTYAHGGRLGAALLAFARYEADAEPGELERGENHLRNVLAVEPGHPHALAQAVLLYLLGDEREAGSYAPLARAICSERDPDHAALAGACAEEAWRRGAPERARELFARATRLDPDAHGAWLRWAILELEAGNLRSARRYLEQATRSPWPSLCSFAGLTLGVVLDRLGDTPGAIASYEQALDLLERCDRPAPPELLYNLGLALTRIADSEAELARAQALLERYLADAQAPEHARLRVQQALAELELIRAEHQRAQR